MTAGRSLLRVLRLTLSLLFLLSPFFSVASAAPPGGYVHRPIVEFFTGLSCSSCMGGPDQDMEKLLSEGFKDPSQPFTGVIFHELNGGGVDDLATDETKERMRHYQPGVSGTPDAEFDGGYIELGGMTSPGGSVTYDNAKNAVDRCRERENTGINPRHPLQNLRTPFKYVNLKVQQYYEDGVVSAVVNLEYLRSSSLLPSQLNAEVYAFVTEMNVPAYSKVKKEVVLNNFVFRGYAIKGEKVTLNPGENRTLAGEWSIPKDVKVPVKPQDLIVVAAVYDLDDTSSEYRDSGNIAKVPRAAQSSNPIATAYDGGWKPPEIKNVTLLKASGGNIRVEAFLQSEKGIYSAYVLYARDKTMLNFTAVKMNLTGEELCDSSGVCYAYGSGMAYAEFRPEEDWGETLTVLVFDSRGVPARSEYVNATHILPAQKESKGVGGGGSMTYLGLLMIFIALVIFWGRLTSRIKTAWALWAALLLLLSGIAAAAYPALTVGSSRAPEFTVKTVDGKTVSLSDFRGKVVLLDIMSTTCSGCEEVIKTMREIFPEYRGKVVFISVSVDPTDTLDTLKNFAEEKGIEWIVASDVERDVLTGYSATQIPKLFIIDGEGRITYEHLGPPSREELKRALDRTLAGGASPLSLSGLSGGAGLTAIALLSGILMFFSPCSFPLLPGYISYTIARTGGRGGVRKGVKLGLIASLGIVTLFMILGIIVAILGGAVSCYLIYLEPVIGILLIVLGYALFRDVNIPFERITQPIKGLLYRILPGRFQGGEESEAAGFFSYGLGYAAGAASCTTPVLLAVVFLGLSTGGFLGALYTFAIFSLAMAALMVAFTALSAAGSERILTASRNWMHRIEKAGALILILVGAYFIWYFFRVSYL